MTIKFAHLWEYSTGGDKINFAVFQADANNRTDNGRAILLYQLTILARRSGLRVDKSALAFTENGCVNFYGTPDLVSYLSKTGVPGWTHSMNV